MVSSVALNGSELAVTLILKASEEGLFRSRGQQRTVGSTKIPKKETHTISRHRHLLVLILPVTAPLPLPIPLLIPNLRQYSNTPSPPRRRIINIHNVPQAPPLPRGRGWRFGDVHCFAFGAGRLLCVLCGFLG